MYQNKNAIKMLRKWKKFKRVGDINLCTVDKRFLPYKKAKIIINKINKLNNVNSIKKWNMFSKSGKRPYSIPSMPYKIYKNKGWTNWYDWFGVKKSYPA